MPWAACPPLSHKSYPPRHTNAVDDCHSRLKLRTTSGRDATFVPQSGQNLASCRNNVAQSIQD